MSDVEDVIIGRMGIERTAAVIRPYVRVTPVIDLQLSDIGIPTPGRLCLKLESLQHAGSFKTRGAFSNLLTRQIPSKGIVAASGGNHGAAVAFASQRLGIPAKIFVPTVASATKLDQIRAYGADLVVTGDRYGDALTASEDWERETGALNIHAFDQAETLLGQGTLGEELHRQAPDLDTVLISVGGGGLIGGVASWYQNDIRIVGVEPAKAPTLTRALEAGKPVDAEAGGVAADSLAPRRVGELVFPIVRQHVDQVILVSDEEIREAQSTLWRLLRVVAEPGGAAAFAAIVAGYYRPAPEERVGVVICGGNTTAVNFDL